MKEESRLSPCTVSVLDVSVVKVSPSNSTTEAQSSQRSHSDASCFCTGFSRSLIKTILLIASINTTTFAHEGKPHTWHDLSRAWSFEPLVVVPLVLMAWLFARGLRQLWRESGTGRGIKRWEGVAFAGGWVALFVALVSPLHAWGRVLFSAHMTQHELLMLVAAPLLVLGRPLIAVMWSMPLRWSRRVGSWGKTGWLKKTWAVLTVPLVAWALHGIALWVWHVPVLFEAVLHSEWVHTFQHLSFLLSALLFWWALIHGRRGWMGYGAAVLYVFTTSVHSGLLGALLTFSNSPWYPSYAGLTDSWGLTAIEDQQLGGLIMWIPAGVLYAIAGLALLAGWLRESEARVVSREHKRAWGQSQQANIIR